MKSLKSFHWAAICSVLLIICCSVTAFDVTNPELFREFQELKASDSDFKVESVEEFAAMKAYRQQLLEDGVTVHTFTMKDGTDCRCIDVYTQNALAAAGIDPEDLTFAPIVLPPEAPKSTSAAKDSDIPMPVFLDGSLDKEGRIRRCPKGSVPKLIPSMKDLYRFKSMSHWFHKYPTDVGKETSRHILQQYGEPGSGSDSFSSSSAVGSHVYAVAMKTQDNIGCGAQFNLWKPEVEAKDEEFSLSQLWVTRGSGNDLQTVESGWQVYRNKYNDDRSHLFIFYTTNNYTQSGDNKGCYNLDCVGFVHTNPDIPIGGGFNNYSTPGGSQYYFGLEFYRDPPSGHWWLRYRDTIWVGYYPTTLFDNAGLKTGGSFFEFGGEVIDDNVNGKTATDMGSGAFPTSGYGKAAYTRLLHYWTPTNCYHASGLTPFTSDKNLYDISLGSSSDNAWREYFYFGGPGANRDAPTLELYYWNHDQTECFAAGDIFDGHYRITNGNPADYNLDLYILLAFMGKFFFWPSWNEAIEYQNLTVTANSTLDDSFLQFIWPGQTGTISGMTIYGAMMKPGTYDHIGEVVSLNLCALGDGDISFKLNWTYSGGGEGPDLDLHVTNPNGYHIYYSNKSSPDGGQLDFDDQGACGPGDGGGPENIFWETGRAPRGRYVYAVDWYAPCGYSSASYTIQVRTNGTVAETQTGTISSGDQAFSIIY